MRSVIDIVDFSVEEISKIMSLGKSAVKMRLARARKLLQDKLSMEDDHVS